MSLIESVRRTLQQHQLAGPTTPVAVALSGGPDSMALLHVLRALEASGDVTLAAVAHFNHQLRDRSDADEQFCSEVASAFGLPFIVERADVRAVALEQGRSLEDAAHVLRYAFFDRACRAAGAEVVALGHTRDDQAETFLLRLVHGAGSRGLAAMYPRNGQVIRPLLDCSRAQVHAFLKERQIPCVHDASNDDVGIPRNRLRAEVLPLLQGRFNPAIVDALAAAAELARADEELLGALVREWVSKHVAVDGDRQVIAIPALREAPAALARRALHQAMSLAAGDRRIGFEDVRRCWAVVLGDSPGFDAPGHRVERYAGTVVLTGRPAGSAGRPTGVAATPAAGFAHHLPVPGEVAIPEIGCVMSAEVVLSAENAPRPNGQLAIVPKEMVAAGLGVRSRRPGDRLQPTTVGHRKLQDLLVDRKVPRGERDRIPIVTDVGGRIVWVAGHALDRDFRVTDPAQAVVILRLKAVGGSC